MKKKKKKRRLSLAGVLLLMCLAVPLAFPVDAALRAIKQAQPSGAGSVIANGRFSGEEAPEQTEVLIEDQGNPEEDNPEEDRYVSLSVLDAMSGPLVLVDNDHPYKGSQNFIDFSSITTANVIPSDPTMTYQAEMRNGLCEMFDAYAAQNGTADLQINCTLQSTVPAGGLYSSILPERDTGYTIDVGLITYSEGIRPYITKMNEWLVENAWKYGFVMRYPADKIAKTGVEFTPSHFRFVGKLHAAIMHEHDFCLEEYLDFIQKYPMEKGGYAYSCDRGDYLVCYVPAQAEGGLTTVQIPAGRIYAVSGTNCGGYVVTLGSFTGSTTTTTVKN